MAVVDPDGEVVVPAVLVGGEDGSYEEGEDVGWVEQDGLPFCDLVFEKAAVGVALACYVAATVEFRPDFRRSEWV